MKKTILKDKKTSQTGNILVYAISSSESDLRICLRINQSLSINLTLDQDYEVLIKEQNIPFRRYHFEFDEGIEKYILFVNRSDGHLLFPELKKVDYILVICSAAHVKSVEALLQDLKKEQEFTVLYKVDPVALRSLSRIVL